jgi:hypothetical protein
MEVVNENLRVYNSSVTYMKNAVFVAMAAIGMQYTVMPQQTTYHICLYSFVKTGNNANSSG